MITLSKDLARAILASGCNIVHRVQYDYKPEMHDELKLESGQLVHILHEWDDGWALCCSMDFYQGGVAPRACLSKTPVKPQGLPYRGRPLLLMVARLKEAVGGDVSLERCLCALRRGHSNHYRALWWLKNYLAHDAEVAAQIIECSSRALSPTFKDNCEPSETESNNGLRDDAVEIARAACHNAESINEATAHETSPSVQSDGATSTDSPFTLHRKAPPTLVYTPSTTSECESDGLSKDQQTHSSAGECSSPSSLVTAACDDSALPAPSTSIIQDEAHETSILPASESEVVAEAVTAADAILETPSSDLIVAGQQDTYHNFYVALNARWIALAKYTTTLTERTPTDLYRIKQGRRLCAELHALGGSFAEWLVQEPLGTTLDLEDQFSDFDRFVTSELGEDWQASVLQGASDTKAAADCEITSSTLLVLYQHNDMWNSAYCGLESCALKLSEKLTMASKKDWADHQRVNDPIDDDSYYIFTQPDLAKLIKLINDHDVTGLAVVDMGDRKD